MIDRAAAEVTAAIVDALDAALPRVTVNVYGYEPETAAAPCVWLTFLESRYERGAGWVNTFEASVVSDAALGALDAQRQLLAMTDAVLDLKCDGVVAVDMVARAGGLSARIGDIPHPVVLVTIPQVTSAC